ncbi:hypothetical protein MOV76_15865 [Rhizobium sp. PRIMUS64]|uniref:hypothetical protein n=1 Tax=Rhizobium sp. PRIMUS64 TaxID=2908925 RepID=UPI001FF23813|nr:hypothetical protein [Rhizobium sp. PRIMUS64]MCJ9693083.1 hypothetical protein [Rhizobium sp. PRIMUS64]
MTDQHEDCLERAFRARHQALRNALYHIARRGWLDGWNRFFNLLVILGGTSAAADLTRGNPKASLVLGGVITLIGALQLVFDFGGRARAHETLQRRYYNLAADIQSKLIPMEQDCASWEAEMSRIAADEPPTLRALDAVADNQATAALLGSNRPRLKITAFQNFTRQIFTHNAGIFPPDPNWLAFDTELTRPDNPARQELPTASDEGKA